MGAAYIHLWARNIAILERFLAGESSEVIGRDLDITRQRVCQIVASLATKEELAQRVKVVPRCGLISEAGRQAIRDAIKARSKRIWPAAKVEKLRRLVALDWSASEIAAVMDTTRNAVIGKAFRLGLSLTGDNPEEHAERCRQAALARWARHREASEAVS